MIEVWLSLLLRWTVSKSTKANGEAFTVCMSLSTVEWSQGNSKIYRVVEKSCQHRCCQFLLFVLQDSLFWTRLSVANDFKHLWAARAWRWKSEIPFIGLLIFAQFISWLQFQSMLMTFLLRDFWSCFVKLVSGQPLRMILGAWQDFYFTFHISHGWSASVMRWFSRYACILAKLGYDCAPRIHNICLWIRKIISDIVSSFQGYCEPQNLTDIYVHGNGILSSNFMCSVTCQLKICSIPWARVSTIVQQEIHWRFSITRC